MTITFFLAHSLGGDVVVAWLGKQAAFHPDLAKLYIQKYHLNDPIYVQYYYYLVGVFQGNLGFSPSRGFIPVTEVIASSLPLTLQIAFFGIIISLSVGILLGVISARYHRSATDNGIRSFYLASYSSPPFFIALLLVILFAYAVHLLPSGGAFDPSTTQPTWITGIPMVDSLLEGNYPYFLSALAHVILPSLALGLSAFGIVTRVVRSSLLDVMRMNYIRTARARGLDEGTVFYKHALRNAMIPIVTLSSLIVTFLITGTIFVESIFAYPGLGLYVVDAIGAQDYPGILASTIIFALVIVLSNLTADILYAVVDPQIRLG